jgi:hypothetical protein
LLVGNPPQVPLMAATKRVTEAAGTKRRSDDDQRRVETIGLEP